MLSQELVKLGLVRFEEVVVDRRDLVQSYLVLNPAQQRQPILHLSRKDLVA